MTADEFRASLESELSWRQEEFIFLKNQLSSISGEREQDVYRKTLVLILYSHMEGYVKIALQSYVQFINEQNLRRGEVVSELTASGMHREFQAYENPGRRSNLFRRSLPDDTALHGLSRRVDLIEQMDGFLNQPLHIEDRVIDTESNLRYVVLQKNLYKVGLPVNLFEQYRGLLDELVNRRNSIAHGELRRGVNRLEFARWEGAVQDITRDVTIGLYESALHQKYLRSKGNHG